jgi:hypothetical protein
MLIGIPGMRLPISIIATFKRLPIRARIPPYLMEIIERATICQNIALLYRCRSGIANQRMYPKI